MTPAPFKRPPIVEVAWLDSMGYPGWRSRESLYESCERVGDLDHYTSGYLIMQKREYVVVVSSLGRIAAGDAIQIPRKSIKRITILREATEYIESEVQRV